MSKSITFSTLSKVNPADIKSWSGKIFLTFDIDWAHDEIIKDSLELVQRAHVPAVWFVTHATPLLKDLRRKPGNELGIHPNFNHLLNGESTNGSHQVIKECMSIVPEARCVRSHSLTQSERLTDLLRDAGLTHISNLFIPYGSGIQTKPFFLWDRMIMVPHTWQDNVSLKMNLLFPEISEISPYINVFDFHPIHVFLNTESLERYERTRPLHKNPKELIKHRYKGYGMRNRLLEILDLSRNT